jgi:hypothetical protein
MFVLTDTDARPKGARRRDRDWVTKNMLKSKALRRGAIATVELRTNHASLEGEIIKQYEELFQLVSVPTPRRCVIAVGSQHWALNPRTHAGRPARAGCRQSARAGRRAHPKLQLHALLWVSKLADFVVHRLVWPLVRNVFMARVSRWLRVPAVHPMLQNVYVPGWT